MQKISKIVQMLGAGEARLGGVSNILEMRRRVSRGPATTQMTILGIF